MKYTSELLLEPEILNESTKLAKIKVSYTNPVDGYTEYHYHREYDDLPKELTEFILTKIHLEDLMEDIEVDTFFNPQSVETGEVPADKDNRVYNPNFIPDVKEKLLSELKGKVKKNVPLRVTISWYDGSAHTMIDATEGIGTSWMRELDPDDGVKVKVVK